jgi:hypothetical protein
MKNQLGAGEGLEAPQGELRFARQRKSGRGVGERKRGGQFAQASGAAGSDASAADAASVAASAAAAAVAC